MAITNRERVSKALELLRDGLAPFVERVVKDAMNTRKIDVRKLRDYAEDRTLGEKPILEWDASGLLRVMWETWNDVFRNILGPAERGYVGELRGHRNKWAHQEQFSGDDAYRVLDTTGRLLASVSAPQQSEEIEKLKKELLRVRFDDQVRGERRKQVGTVIKSEAPTRLKPWREVVSPHPDVANGRYQQADFAADLWWVYLGKGEGEYKDPVEFFRRTYLTESLKDLLGEAIRRLSGLGGAPVVQLQTNFGGGKTHCMLALYHLFSETPFNELDGVDDLMGKVGVSEFPKNVKRVVLVGNRISQSTPTTKPDGTVVRTLWGELAWQLGGKEAFARIAADDEHATNPGDALRELFDEYGPCLVLIDEWVAYARALHDGDDLPAGSFETQFSFAQTLTESAKLADRCLLVVSLPMSESTDNSLSRIQANNAEVGGPRGQDALKRLRNVIGRVELSWRPASAEEGFEIVRRRLFVPFSDQQQFKDRDVVAKAFMALYGGEHHQEFPPECKERDYEERIKIAYPIHPEIFDRLYEDWSTQVTFQRTRGVLRLMATVIHSLCANEDRNPLILPAHVAIDDPQVQSELTRYLPDNWTSIIEKDVDGQKSLPARLDGEVPSLLKYNAARRVARTIYLGSAPTVDAAHQGLEDRRIKLGCAMPGEQLAFFADALRRLAESATYLYRDGNRYWYSTQPTVTKLAEDRAELLKREPDKVVQEITARLQALLKGDNGGFSRVHVLPHSPQDVPDEFDARLVVLGVKQAYSRDAGCPAEAAAQEILESRGAGTRMYRNTLVFLAADAANLEDLEVAVCSFLAWKSITDESESLNLTLSQIKQAEAQRDAAATTVGALFPETYQRLLVPTQKKEAEAPVEWQAPRLSGQGSLAERASKKLKQDELLTTTIAATRLRMELDGVPLWRQNENHVAVKQVIDDFARYLYLPRVSGPSVLLDAITKGVCLPAWEKEAFAFAESYDEDKQEYLGLHDGGTAPSFDPDNPKGLLVKPEVARRQLDQEKKEADSTPESGENTAGPGEGAGTGTTTGPGTGVGEGGGPVTTGPGEGAGAGNTTGEASESAPSFKRFHGAVELDLSKIGSKAGEVGVEIISHLALHEGAEVTVTLEIEANCPDGFSEGVVRTVNENVKVLKFSHGKFEKE